MRLTRKDLDKVMSRDGVPRALGHQVNRKPCEQSPPPVFFQALGEYEEVFKRDAVIRGYIALTRTRQRLWQRATVIQGPKEIICTEISMKSIIFVLLLPSLPQVLERPHERESAQQQQLAAPGSSSSSTRAVGFHGHHHAILM